MTRAGWRTVKVIVVYLSLCILLLIICFSNFLINLNQYNEKTARQLISSVETVIKQGGIAGDSVQKKYPGPTACEEMLPDLRELTTTLPYVRSVNVAQGNKIVCSSLQGQVNVFYDASHYAGNKLELHSSSLVQSRHPVLLVKIPGSNMDVLSVIDGVYISNILSRVYGDNLTAAFNVGNTWLLPDGKMSWAEPVYHLFGKEILKSQEYPFAVLVAINSASPLITFLREKWISTGLLLILYSVAFGMAVKYLNRPYSLVTDIQRGLRENEFVPYAQTIVDARSGDIYGIEILMRWQHVTQGLVRPDLFIPQAEESDLIVPMTRALFRKTASILHDYRDRLPESFHVGFNISARHCNDNSLLDDCRKFLTTVGTQRVHLTLELTERYPVEVSTKTSTLFRKLEELGIALAIDDFGTGHSSLSYFKDFRISYVKIDKSFVSQTGSDAVSEQLIDNIIDLGKRLELKIIAEGVENQSQVNRLREMEVDYMQGYLYSRPVPLEELLTSLSQHLPAVDDS